MPLHYIYFLKVPNGANGCNGTDETNQDPLYCEGDNQDDGDVLNNAVEGEHRKNGDGDGDGDGYDGEDYLLNHDQIRNCLETINKKEMELQKLGKVSNLLGLFS